MRIKVSNDVIGIINSDQTTWQNKRSCSTKVLTNKSENLAV